MAEKEKQLLQSSNLLRQQLAHGRNIPVMIIVVIIILVIVIVPIIIVVIIFVPIIITTAIVINLFLYEVCVRVSIDFK